MNRTTRTVKTAEESEFGDFQTPAILAEEVCAVTRVFFDVSPLSVVEPTCGHGTLLFAALDAFPSIERGLGADVSPLYIAAANAKLALRPNASRVNALQVDFFQADWASLLRDLPDPILVIGNPPWVTNAHVGVLGGANLPTKSNFQKRAGLDAITGKANFDISEWMLIQSLGWLNGRTGCLAMLCKTAVARKLLIHAWKGELNLKRAAIYRIDALKNFGAAVDACLFVCKFSPGATRCDCQVYSGFGAVTPERIIGYRHEVVVSCVDLYDKWKHLKGEELYKWRSGIKHDCSKVMELEAVGRQYVNGFGETVDLEDTYLYPMLKTSELANGKCVPHRFMVVPQTSTGADTSSIEANAPKTWQYLNTHKRMLNARGSSIYRNRPPFSVFGIGDYSFSPWKVGISGFYKRLDFRVVGPSYGKPTVLDDSSYFVGCRSKEEAELIAHLLNSPPAHGFLTSCIFWDSKRPITIDVLRRLDMGLLARELGLEPNFHSYANTESLPTAEIASLFD